MLSHDIALIHSILAESRHRAEAHAELLKRLQSGGGCVCIVALDSPS